jgi:hypothetical protein
LLQAHLASAQTITYTNASTYTNVVPAGVKQATFKLWGAGGGGSLQPGPPFPIIAFGGGGAFSSVTLDVQSGDTFVIIVGQGGAINDASRGGAGSGNTAGGAPGIFNGSVGRSQGGQASSVFFLTNNLLMTKAIAGGGGGAGLGANGGAGGQPGQSQPPALGGLPGQNGNGGIGESPGGDYNSVAITAGISALNLAGGNGGNGLAYSGGGGGGYGGGAGGGGNPAISGTGGGGGGSYGTSITNGAGTFPGNNSDSDYAGSAGQGGTPNVSGLDGQAVLTWIPASIPTGPTLVSPTILVNGSFQFSFTNVPGATFSAQATTNLADSNSWSILGTAVEISSGQFQFTDTQATNHPAHFYRVRSN